MGNFLKRIFSYILPFRIKDYNSAVNGSIQINLVNGKRVLDTPMSNYSYGSLQNTLHRGLKAIEFDHNTKNILVLGLGGGSIIETIREEFKVQSPIVAVDIDAEMITIAQNEFEIGRFEKIEIVQADAQEYLNNCTDQFDLIVVDIFIIDTIPEIFTQPEFMQSLLAHLTAGGKIIYNILNRTMTSESLLNMIAAFSIEGNVVKLLKKVEQTNSLILVEKRRPE